MIIIIADCTYLNYIKNFGNLTQKSQEEYINSKRCVIGVFDYKSALLYSVETMSTIGFGSRVITSRCITSMFLLLSQSIIGIILPTVWTAVIIAKFKSVYSVFTIRFSAKAAITLEDGRYFLKVCIISSAKLKKKAWNPTSHSKGQSGSC